MKKWLAFAIATALILFGTYFGSAYWAATNLKQSAADGDADSLDAAVDFPAVRESLKSQMSAALINKMQNDPKMRDNPFAGLGMMMMPALVDRAIDAYITPDGIAAMARGEKPREVRSESSHAANSDVEFSSNWVSMDRFQVSSANKSTGESGPAFLFERRGFITWKLIKIELPDSILAGS